MQHAISFEQAPPISVPFRFFLTAPCFGVAAGAILLILGPDVLASRWTPGALALAHLLTVGFMLQAMCGATLQLVPVVAGGNVWRPRALAAIVHPAIAVGAVLMAAAFLDWRLDVLLIAAALLAAGLGAYIAVLLVALLRTTASSATVSALRFAVLGLAITIAVGLVLVEAMRGSVTAPLAAIANLHAAWGLGGWALLLLAGVSMSVVPMFQLTPAYPAWLGRVLPAGLLLVLAAASLLTLLSGTPLGLSVVLSAGLVLAAAFAAATLWLQQRRRRKATDPTFILFRIAMISLLAATGWLLFLTLGPDSAAASGAAAAIGVLLLVGVFMSAINGMLYKIVPFLNWLHLQRLSGATAAPPNMRLMISERAMRGQTYLHCAALVLLLSASYSPVLSRLAGAAFAVSCAWLEWNLLAGLRAYVRFRDRTRAAAALDGSGSFGR